MRFRTVKAPDHRFALVDLEGVGKEHRRERECARRHALTTVAVTRHRDQRLARHTNSHAIASTTAVHGKVHAVNLTPDAKECARGAVGVRRWAHSHVREAPTLARSLLGGFPNLRAYSRLQTPTPISRSAKPCSVMAKSRRRSSNSRRRRACIRSHGRCGGRWPQRMPAAWLSAKSFWQRVDALGERLYYAPADIVSGEHS